MTEKKVPKIVIIGGGTAGITVAARLMRMAQPLEITLLEPSTKHYYQPLWTLVGAGVSTIQETVREEKNYIPSGVTWIQEAASHIDPEKQTVTTTSGKNVAYDFLVVAPGLVVHIDRIKGLAQAIGKEGVCTIYGHEHAPAVWEQIKQFQGGQALFTFRTPLKCGGAPQKIMYLADDAWRKQGVREKSEITFFSTGEGLFGVPPIRDALLRVVARKNIHTQFKHDLIEVRPQSKEAIFAKLDALGKPTDTIVRSYDFLHVTPPQAPPTVVSESPLAFQDGPNKGWLEVDFYTLQHPRYANVFGLGDVGAFPTAKTGAAIRKQAPILVHNLLATLRQQGPDAFQKYDGYSSCPLVTGYGKVILAEFDYKNNLTPSFPLDPTKERRSMWWLKRYLLPPLYWHGMLRGRA